TSEPKAIAAPAAEPAVVPAVAVPPPPPDPTPVVPPLAVPPPPTALMQVVEAMEREVEAAAPAATDDEVQDVELHVESLDDDDGDMMPLARSARVVLFVRTVPLFVAYVARAAYRSLLAALPRLARDARERIRTEWAHATRRVRPRF